MQGCIFCKVACGEAPAFRVCEEHFENLFEASADAMGAVMATAQRVAYAIQRVLHPDGLMVFQLNGAAAGQSVFHYQCT